MFDWLLENKPHFWQPGFGNDWLEQLHELILPQTSFSVWPQGPGIYMLLMIALLILLRAAHGWRRNRSIRRFQQHIIMQLNNFRRAGQGAAAVTGLAELLKRVEIFTNAEPQAKGTINWTLRLQQAYPCLSAEDVESVQLWAYWPTEKTRQQQPRVDQVLSKLHSYMQSRAFYRQLKHGWRNA